MSAEGLQILTSFLSQACGHFLMTRDHVNILGHFPLHAYMPTVGHACAHTHIPLLFLISHTMVLS